MKTKIIGLVLSLLFIMPCLLQAEETVIPLMEIVSSGDEPLDGPNQDPSVPTRPNDFRATIDGNVLNISKQNEYIQNANVLVVQVSTGNVVFNQLFTSELSTEIQSSGSHWLKIHTPNGTLVGIFNIQ